MAFNPDPRSVINGAMVTLASLVALLAILSAVPHYQDYRLSEQLIAASRTADGIIRAAGLHAMERGWTAAALGGPLPASQDMRREIDELRRRGDAIWQQALRDARGVADQQGGNELVERDLKHANDAFEAAEKARQRVDHSLIDGEVRIQDGEWIDVLTAFIESGAHLREDVLTSLPMSPELARFNLSLKQWVWLASEYAGRERGIVAYYVAARRPLPLHLKRELAAYRGVVDRQLQRFRHLASQTWVPQRIRRAIDVMERIFLEDYEPLRRGVYDAEHGNYPVGAAQWLRDASIAIDTLWNIATAATAVTAEHTRALHDASVWRLTGDLSLLAGTGVLLAFGLGWVRRSANDLYRQKQLAEITLHSIGDAVITTDVEARIEYLNPVAEELTGWSLREAAGRRLSEVFRLVNGLTNKPLPDPILACLVEERVVGLESGSVLRRKDGSEVAIEDSAAPIRDRDGRLVGAIMVFFDVTSLRDTTQILSHQATHDPLTQLINRREFERRLTELLVRAKNSNEQHALCYVDLDQFKLVNDTCGHMAGDKLLRELAYLLHERVRDTDTLARLGGDEFGLLLSGCHLERARAISQDLLEVIRNFRFVWRDKAFDLGASMGLVPITAQSISPGELLSEADAACFAAKESGRNRVHIFDPGDMEVARRRGEMHWVSRINRAMDEDRLVLYCQTIRPTKEQAAIHGEVLVRMLDEDGTLVLPTAFIPAAERYNVMPKVDRWVVTEALGTMGRYLAANPGARLMCNINVSGSTLGEPGFGDFARNQIQQHGVPASMVCFEITETVAVANFEAAVTLIKTLREEGCLFALDDFGSGISSFGYLKNMPVDLLKIDGRLVREMAVDPIAHGMVRAIHQVGHLMGLETVGEHVSDPAILAKLEELGVDYVQGFHIGTPRPMVECLGTCGRRGA